MQRSVSLEPNLIKFGKEIVEDPESNISCCLKGVEIKDQNMELLNQLTDKAARFSYRINEILGDVDKHLFSHARPMTSGCYDNMITFKIIVLLVCYDL